MTPIKQTTVYVPCEKSDADYYMDNQGDLIPLKEQSLYCFTKEELVKLIGDIWNEGLKNGFSNAKHGYSNENTKEQTINSLLK